MVGEAQNRGEENRSSLRVEVSPIRAKAGISSSVTGRRVGGGYLSLDLASLEGMAEWGIGSRVILKLQMELGCRRGGGRGKRIMKI